MKIKVTYITTWVNHEQKPIGAANTIDEMLEYLDDYNGANGKYSNKSNRISYLPIENSDLVGVVTYYSEETNEIDRFQIYEADYYTKDL
jgi:hypothetical protein